MWMASRLLHFAAVLAMALALVLAKSPPELEQEAELLRKQASMLADDLSEILAHDPRSHIHWSRRAPTPGDTSNTTANPTESPTAPPTQSPTADPSRRRYAGWSVQSCADCIIRCSVIVPYMALTRASRGETTLVGISASQFGDGSAQRLENVLAEAVGLPSTSVLCTTDMATFAMRTSTAEDAAAAASEVNSFMASSLFQQQLRDAGGNFSGLIAASGEAVQLVMTTPAPTPAEESNTNTPLFIGMIIAASLFCIMLTVIGFIFYRNHFAEALKPEIVPEKEPLNPSSQIEIPTISHCSTNPMATAHPEHLKSDLPPTVGVLPDTMKEETVDTMKEEIANPIYESQVQDTEAVVNPMYTDEVDLDNMVAEHQVGIDLDDIDGQSDCSSPLIRPDGEQILPKQSMDI